MSKEFHEGLKDFDLNDETLLNKMSDYEHEMDDLTHEILFSSARISSLHLTEKTSTFLLQD